MFEKLRPQRYPVAIPTEVDDKPLNGQRCLTESALVTIRSALEIFHTMRRELYDIELVPLDAPVRRHYHRPRAGARSGFEELRMLPATDGMALLKATHGSLVDWTVRLDVPIRGEVRYDRIPFNVDFQCMEPDPIHARGADEIAKHPKAVIDILSFERDIVRGSMLAWECFTFD